MAEFTHLDAKGTPAMVDVGAKPVTKRIARARAVVILPDQVLELLQAGDIQTRKGAVFQTAILAGIMAAKRTGELIPLCHPLGLDNCQVDIRINDDNEVLIDCTASNTGKTGVEMEALTGASIAALTVYDMCKALSHHIVIREIRLLEKRGGKKDFISDDAQNS
ncbi:MAG: cyclic pyranopterin monophosphate synthase MoaC [Bacteroidetes bacterium]|nr:MAG: cyclic pyranopterin monophosphate synthase MoaC [Bacteroidota bacterium]